jgi:hypothetical protein
MKQRLIIASMICLAFLLPSCQPSGSAASGVVSPEPAVASLSSEPSLTLTQKPTKTATLSPSPTVTSTATPTVKPTPIAMPRLRIAYGDMDGLWFAEPPAPPVQLVANTFMFEISFSDDGSRIIYYSKVDPLPIFHDIGVIFINADGNPILRPSVPIGSLEYYGGEEGWVSDSVWIPGTHRLLFSTYGPGGQNGFFYSDDLFVLDADSGSVSRIYGTGAGGMASPSPDGKTMVVSDCGTIFLASVLGRVLFRDLIPLENKERGKCFSPQVFWAADSSRFAILEESASDGASIWSVDAASGAAAKLENIPDYYYGALSPDLNYIGYTINKETVSSDATISKVDGAGAILLVKGKSYFRTFSPDGRHFDYWAHDTAYIGSLDGSTIPIQGLILCWINNSQFIFIKDDTLYLGDVGGNVILIAKGNNGMQPVAAIDVDFKNNHEK